MTDVMYKKQQKQQFLVLASVIPWIWILLHIDSIDVLAVSQKIENNFEVVINWVLFLVISTTACIFITLIRVILLTFNTTNLDSAASVIFHSTLSVALSFGLTNFDLEIQNSFTEEIACCSIIGFNLHKILFLENVLADKKIFNMLSHLVIIFFTMNVLAISRGASVLLTFAYLFSSSVAVLQLPSFGSSRYKHTLAFKVTVPVALAFAAHQRLIMSSSAVLKLWKSSKVNLEQFEFAYLLTLCCSALAVSVFTGGWLTTKRHLASYKEKVQRQCAVDDVIERGPKRKFC